MLKCVCFFNLSKCSCRMFSWTKTWRSLSLIYFILYKILFTFSYWIPIFWLEFKKQQLHQIMLLFCCHASVCFCGVWHSELSNFGSVRSFSGLTVTVCLWARINLWLELKLSFRFKQSWRNLIYLQYILSKHPSWSKSYIHTYSWKDECIFQSLTEIYFDQTEEKIKKIV